MLYKVRNSNNGNQGLENINRQKSTKLRFKQTLSVFIWIYLIYMRSLPIQNQETWICQFKMLDNYLSKKCSLKINRTTVRHVGSWRLNSKHTTEDWMYHFDNFEITLINAPFSSRSRWLSALSCSRLWNRKQFLDLSWKYFFILITKLWKAFENIKGSN